jgi:hypothetical protein
LKTELNQSKWNPLNILPKLLGNGLADPKESTIFNDLHISTSYAVDVSL